MELALECERAATPYAMLTVVRALRPTSACAGDKALLRADGAFFGWVGGSCAEPSARRLAQVALADGKPRLMRLTNEMLADALPGVEVLPMSCFSGGTLEIFIEPRVPSVSVVVVGSSPTAEALGRVVAAAGYRLGTQPSSPDGWRGLPPPDERTAVVVAAHGRQEIAALQWALQGSARYVGLVASHKRALAVRAALKAAGVPSRCLEKLEAPAGVDLGGRAPGDVAVSIMARIVERGAAGRDSRCVHGMPSAVVLAAGLSHRMGQCNKLLQDLGGQPLVRRTLQQLLAAGVEDVVVVTGHEDGAVRGALEGLPVRFVHNEGYAAGQQGSVRVGLAALTGTASSVMVCLGDLPLVSADDYRALVKAFESRPRGDVLVPGSAERRGNPVIMTQEAAQAALAAPIGACRPFIDASSQRVWFWHDAPESLFADVDDVEGLERARKQLERGG